MCFNKFEFWTKYFNLSIDLFLRLTSIVSNILPKPFLFLLPSLLLLLYQLIWSNLFLCEVFLQFWILFFPFCKRQLLNEPSILPSASLMLYSHLRIDYSKSFLFASKPVALIEALVLVGVLAKTLLFVIEVGAKIRRIFPDKLTFSMFFSIHPISCVRYFIILWILEDDLPLSMRNKQCLINISFVSFFIIVKYFSLECLLIALEIEKFNDWHIFMVFEGYFARKRKRISPYPIKNDALILIHILSMAISLTIFHFSLVEPSLFQKSHLSFSVGHIIFYLTFIKLYSFFINYT